MVGRVISSLFGVLVVLALLVWAALYTSLDAVRSWPSEANIAGLSAPGSIVWSEDGIPFIEAGAPHDQIAALGYTHGMSRTWTVALLRQTAAGKLGEWFGRPADTLDIWARQLGWAHRARERFNDLTADQKAWFRTYARGMNAGFEARSSRTPELLLLEIELEPWKPWHALAVEQLVAWLGVSNAAQMLKRQEDPSLKRWMRAEHLLHRWLRFHDFEQSTAWTLTDGAEVSLYQRQVYGSSALPLLEEVSVKGQRGIRHIASIPGTLVFPGGVGPEVMWAVFPTSTAFIDSVSTGGSASSPRRELIQRRDGSEHVTEVQESDRGLIMGRRYRLEWSGFTDVTDVEAWQALWNGRDPGEAFGLFRGDGLMVDGDGAVSILGDPPVERRFEQGVAVGYDRWVDRLVPAIRRGDSPYRGRDTTLRSVGREGTELYSPWADSLRNRVVSALGSSNLWRMEMQEAMAYLRNWEGRFDGASIGASIFETWLDVYSDSTGRLPSVDEEWSADTRILLYKTFDRAVGRLSDRYGSDMSRWRWEDIQPADQYFPVWSAPDAVPSGASDMARKKYGPVTPSGEGHPSALQWGTSVLTSDELAVSAVWEGAAIGSFDRRLYVRKTDVPVDDFLGRYLEAPEYPRTFVLDTARTGGHRVRLHPVNGTDG